MFRYALIPELLTRERLSHQQQQAAGDFGGQDATDPTRIELGSEFHHVCALREDLLLWLKPAGMEDTPRSAFHRHRPPPIPRPAAHLTRVILAANEA